VQSSALRGFKNIENVVGRSELEEISAGGEE
jgi:hypothetical protein